MPSYQKQISRLASLNFRLSYRKSADPQGIFMQVPQDEHAPAPHEKTHKGVERDLRSGVQIMLGSVGSCTVLAYYSEQPILVGFMAWFALCFSLLSFSMFVNARVGTRMLGKDLRTGRLPALRFLFFAPFLLPMYLIWFIKHAILRENVYDAVLEEGAAGQLYVGRYPLYYPKRFPKAATIVVDLTAEFPAPSGVRQGRSYFCVPSMDRVMAPPDALAKSVQQVASMRDSSAYIHCANGHGRSALFAAMVMVRRGHVATLREALVSMKKKRSVINWQPHQEATCEYALSLLERNQIPLQEASHALSEPVAPGSQPAGLRGR